MRLHVFYHAQAMSAHLIPANSVVTHTRYSNALSCQCLRNEFIWINHTVKAFSCKEHMYFRFHRSINYVIKCVLLSFSQFNFEYKSTNRWPTYAPNYARVTILRLRITMKSHWYCLSYKETSPRYCLFSHTPHKGRVCKLLISYP